MDFSFRVVLSVIMERKHYYTGLILKYLEDKISPTEKEALQAWLVEHEDHQALFQSIRSNWHATGADVQKAEKAFQQLAYQIGLQEHPASGKLPHARKSRKMHPYWLRIAASFTGLLMVAAIAYYMVSGTETKLYTTGYGETAIFVLPDSSVVTLNANSTLEYTANWQQQALREVWLNGEAFFHVKKIQQSHTAKLPVKFVVHTTQVDVEVLGTEFNVNERRGTTRVVLNSGKVKLNANLSQAETLVMEPGEYVELSAEHRQFVRKVVDPELYSSWTEKKLLLDNTPLQEIARIIEDYYGLKVKFENTALAEKTLTGSIPTDDLHTFLTVLSASIDVEMQQEENTLTISEKEAP